MNVPFGVGETERFRDLIARRFGLRFEDAKLGFLADVLRRRLDANHRVCGTYLARLEADPPRQELGALAQELTVAETYFFRNPDQFRAFKEVVLPERLRARASRKCLRILSAGCASGEEPYSIAMLVRETTTDPSWQVSIRAVDINPAILEKAARARFSPWSLRETSSEIQQRWFQQNGREAVLADAVRDAVTFEERNLADDNVDLWQAGAYDVIFCRNVIMYFTPPNAHALVARVARALAPGGYLFLGHAETLRGLSLDFHLRHTHETFYYQRRDGAEYVESELALVTAPSNDFVPTLADIVNDTDTWVETIGKAADRIRTLTQTPAPSSTQTVIPRQPLDLGVAFDLLQKERFEEAINLVQAFPSESARDPDLLLLRAVLLAHSGKLVDAEEVCRKLLEIDELNAGAHYLLGLCREGAGDRRAAADHDQVAVYLDPAFAMPRLHLGLLARRAGERESARRELDQALTLLQCEDASRVLLFGGGFNREALLALCRAELRACGDRP